MAPLQGDKRKKIETLLKKGAENFEIRQYVDGKIKLELQKEYG